MKYALLLAILGGCGVLYVHQEHPQFSDRVLHTTQAAANDIQLLWLLWQNYHPAPSAPVQATPDIDPMMVTRSWTKITTRYGQTIAITKVTAVDAHSIHYEMENGAGSVEISDLPKDVQQSLGYDPVAGKQAYDAEMTREAASDAMVANVTAAQDENSAIVASQPVSDSDYTRAQSDLNDVSSHVVVDSGTGYVSGDTYWVRRYWDDRHRKEAYERQRAERVAVTGRHEQAVIDERRSENDRRVGSYSQPGNQAMTSSPQREAHPTAMPRPSPASAPVSGPEPPPPPRAPTLPVPVSNH